MGARGAERSAPPPAVEELDEQLRPVVVQRAGELLVAVRRSRAGSRRACAGVSNARGCRWVASMKIAPTPAAGASRGERDGVGGRQVVVDRPVWWDVETTRFPQARGTERDRLSVGAAGTAPASSQPAQLPLQVGPCAALAAADRDRLGEVAEADAMAARSGWQAADSQSARKSDGARCPRPPVARPARRHLVLRPRTAFEAGARRARRSGRGARARAAAGTTRTPPWRRRSPRAARGAADPGCSPVAPRLQFARRRVRRTIGWRIPGPPARRRAARRDARGRRIGDCHSPSRRPSVGLRAGGLDAEDRLVVRLRPRAVDDQHQRQPARLSARPGLSPAWRAAASSAALPNGVLGVRGGQVLVHLGEV